MGGARDWPAVGNEPTRGRPYGALEQGRRDYRRPWCWQDHAGQFDPEDPDGETGVRGAVRADGPGCEAVIRKYRPGGKDHSPPAGNRPADWRIPPDGGQSA